MRLLLFTFLLSFKPTYEGWKFNNPIGATDGDICFEPTYKGWKCELLHRVSRLGLQVLSLPTRDGNSRLRNITWPRNRGFKPTYKGWKLKGKVVYNSPVGSVLSLPTRDGNQEEDLGDGIIF